MNVRKAAHGRSVTASDLLDGLGPPGLALIALGTVVIAWVATAGFRLPEEGSVAHYGLGAITLLFAIAAILISRHERARYAAARRAFDDERARARAEDLAGEAERLLPKARAGQRRHHPPRCST